MIVIGMLCFFLGFLVGAISAHAIPKRGEWIPMPTKSSHTIRMVHGKQATVIDLQDPIEKVIL